MAYNDVFADIVNVLLFSGKPVIAVDDLAEQAPRSAYKADGKIREIERDVIKRWVKNNVRIACFGLENQTNPDPDMVLRVYGYDGAEYRAQLLKENIDKPRYPVITLVLYFGYKCHWNKPLCLHEAIQVPDFLKPYVPNIKINLFEIAYLSEEQLNCFQSDFKIVADYFIQMQKNGSYNPRSENLIHVESVLRLLSIMTNDTIIEEILNSKDYIKGGVQNMSGFWETVKAEGRNEGIAMGEARGIAMGEARGIAMGEARGKIIGVIQLYHDEMHLSPSEITKRIMLRFSLDENEAEKSVEEALGVKFEK